MRGEMAFIIKKREWGCVSDDRLLKTTHFGPCYIMAGYDPYSKLRFLAHIDTETSIETVRKIFDIMKEEISEFELNRTQISLYGGWQKHLESRRWGDQILSVLKDLNVKPNVEYWQKKMFSSYYPKWMKICFASRDIIQNLLSITLQPKRVIIKA